MLQNENVLKLESSNLDEICSQLLLNNSHPRCSQYLGGIAEISRQLPEVLYFDYFRKFPDYKMSNENTSSSVEKLRHVAEFGIKMLGSF